MWNSVQVPSGGSESVTIIRFPQESTIKIQGAVLDNYCIAVLTY